MSGQEQQNNPPRKKATRKKQLSTAEAKKLIPAIKKMNAATELLLSLFKKKLTHEEQQVAKIRVMVSDMLLPPNLQRNISVTTFDMNKTQVRQRGRMGYNQVMDWEKDYKKRNKGTML